MRREPAAFLWDIQTAARRAGEFTMGMDLAGFAANDLVQAGVERQFEIMGEALAQLSRTSPDVAAQLPDVARIIAFRNLLIHGYAIVDVEIVWQVLRDHLPLLEEAVSRLLAALVPPASPA